MSNLHPLFAEIIKPHLEGQKVVKRALKRYRVLEGVHAELEAAGAAIDIGQLDWASKEITDRLYEESLDRQFEEEKEAEREERRQYRDWRNDSGV